MDGGSEFDGDAFALCLFLQGFENLFGKIVEGGIPVLGKLSFAFLGGFPYGLQGLSITFAAQAQGQVAPATDVLQRELLYSRTAAEFGGVPLKTIDEGCTMAPS